MKTCKTCKFWKRRIRGLPHGKCSCPKFIYTSKHDVTSDTLIYCDYECYDASLETGEDFGCIHHKAIKAKV